MSFFTTSELQEYVERTCTVCARTLLKSVRRKLEFVERGRLLRDTGAVLEEQTALGSDLTRLLDGLEACPHTARRRGRSPFGCLEQGSKFLVGGGEQVIAVPLHELFASRASGAESVGGRPALRAGACCR